MRTVSGVVDANGRLEIGDCWGFMVEAGQPPPGASGYAAGNRPGRFPVSIQPDNESAITVANGGSRYFDRARQVVLRNGVQGDTYTVTLFESATEAAQPSGQKTRASVPTIAAGTAVPTAAPVSSSDGYAINPGTTGFNLYLAGTARTITVWQRSAAGNWYQTGTTIDMTADSLVDFYNVYSPADRIYFQASGASATMEMDFVQEVG
jgi:hypothetical protein